MTVNYHNMKIHWERFKTFRCKQHPKTSSYVHSDKDKHIAAGPSQQAAVVANFQSHHLNPKNQPVFHLFCTKWKPSFKK